MVVDRPDMPRVIAKLCVFHKKKVAKQGDVAFGAEKLVPSRSR
jgi:hypothetical protein